MKVRDAIDRIERLEKIEEGLSALQKYLIDKKTKEELESIKNNASINRPVDMLLIDARFEIKNVRESLKERMYEAEF